MNWHHIRLTLVGVSVAACAGGSLTTSATPVAAAAHEPLSDADRARQALARFTFGARPGDLATVERMGVDAWLEQQLQPERLGDRAADSVLDLLDITHKSAFELVADHPQAIDVSVGAVILQQALQAQKKSDTMKPVTPPPGLSAAAQLAAIRAGADDEMKRTTVAARLGVMRASATRELPTAILLRASLSERQLLEVMTVFWENHFSVAAEKMPNPFTLVDYDRTIRRHALGKFPELLRAVATSPAMLFYLDNYQSSVDSLHPTPIEWQVEQRRSAHPPLGDTSLIHVVTRRRTGVNENYARELMELHTLGVDGGYTQRDVQEVARCLTGWGLDNPQYGGEFAFHSALHDAGDKTVLGTRIPGGRGIEDGEQVLDILARQPATAHFIAKKLVVRFVSDSAPAVLVDRVAQVYLRTGGDIKEMIRTIARSPEFNSREAYRAKVKTPFELVASVLRVMSAAPDTTQQAVQLVSRLGQPIFGRQTPDGWPDQGAAWMNTGALMQRINIGAQVSAGQLAGVRVANWKPRQALVTLPAAQQVDGVIGAMLSGDASAEVRQSLLAVASPPGTTQHIGELVSIVIGSSDFQRR